MTEALIITATIMAGVQAVVAIIIIGVCSITYSKERDIIDTYKRKNLSNLSYSTQNKIEIATKNISIDKKNIKQSFFALLASPFAILEVPGFLTYLSYKYLRWQAIIIKEAMKA